MAKAITNEQKKVLLALKQEELSISKLTLLIGKTSKLVNGKMVIVPPQFDLRSPMHLNAREYINKKEVDTTVGSFLFNKLMIEGMVEPVIPNGYYNEIINKKGFGKLIDLISEGLMTQKIPVDPNLIKWLKQYEFYGMKLSTVVSPSYTRGLLRKNPSVQKQREILLKNGNTDSVAHMTDIEDKLVSASAKILDKDPGMTLFKSGARGSFDNDYKNMNLMLGPVARPGRDGEYDMVTHSYLEGMQKEDMVPLGNNVVNAAYPKAVCNNKDVWSTVNTDNKGKVA